MIFFSKSAEHFWLRYSAGLLDKRNLAISLEKYSQKHDFGFMKDKFTSVRSAKFLSNNEFHCHKLYIFLYLTLGISHIITSIVKCVKIIASFMHLRLIYNFHCI